MERTPLERDRVDQIVFGAVVADVAGPNIAREVALRTVLPAKVDAFSVSRACATSTQAIVGGAMAIAAGTADVVIAGGADSLSRPPIMYDEAVVDALMAASAAKDVAAKVRAFATVASQDLAPRPPALADLSSGLTMGEAAEKMARENGISRQDQDLHRLRLAPEGRRGVGEGRLRRRGDAVPVPPAFEATVDQGRHPPAPTPAWKSWARSSPCSTATTAR